MKKLLAALTAVAVILSLTACNEKTIATITVDNTAVSVSQSDTPSSDVPATATTAPSDAPVTDEERLWQDIDALFETMRNAVAANDYTAFAACFTETSDTVISRVFSDFDQHLRRTQFFAVPTGKIDDNHYCVTFMSANVIGSYPTTNTEHGGYSSVIKRTSDGWKVFENNDFAAGIDLRVLFPEELVEAQQYGYNAAQFNPHFNLYLRHSQAIRGCVDVIPRYIWQSPNGDINLGFALNNGLDNNIQIYNIDLTLTDSIHGTVWDGVFDDAYTVTAGNSLLVYTTIPANDVLTQFERWNDVRFNITFCHE